MTDIFANSSNRQQVHHPQKPTAIKTSCESIITENKLLHQTLPTNHK